MTHPIRFFIISGVIVALTIAGIYALGAQPPSMDKRTVQLTDAETAAVKGFETRLAEYAALRQKLDGNLKPPDKSATPEEIDAYREQLRGQIKTARVSAKRGDFFTPGMEGLVKRVCAMTVSGKDGKQVKDTIMDENPGHLPDLTVNERYPDGVPITTMPPQLLETLPKLQDKMEYHFVGKRLVLVDAAAGVVLDYTPNVLP